MRVILDLQGCQSSSRLRGIGRYSLSLAKSILRNAGDHDIWIVLSDLFPGSIEELRAEFAGLLPTDKLIVMSLPGPVKAQAGRPWRAAAAELIREHAISELRPDVVHISSLFEGYTSNSITTVKLLDPSPLVAVTHYDLIQHLDPDTHLVDPRLRKFFYRKLEMLKRVDLMLAISSYSGEEAARELGIPPDRIVNISSGVGESFRPGVLDEADSKALMTRHGLSRPFAMTTGIAEPRKNLEGLIKAFGRVPAELRNRYQLLLVCQATEADQLRLKGIARNAGLADDDLVITGFVTDNDLVALYRSTSLFVFPSLHEGFGLPALEAMACGAPVIGSNVTSLPEAIGKADALFNPLLLDEMAAMISKALGDAAYRKSLLAHAAHYPARFSWDETGRRALQAFEDAVEKREPDKHRSIASAPFSATDAARDSKNLLYPKLLKYLSALNEPSDDADWVAAASAIAFNQRADRPKQLLVDVSILSAFDAKSGIQRVTRAVVMQLLATPPTGWQVRPVRVDRAALKYRYADEFARTMGGPEQEIQVGDDWVDPSSGDIFLGLDLAADIVPQTRPWFEALRRRGVKIYFVVYDLLPILRPEWFSEGIATVFPPWLTTLGAVSDGVVAISKAVADDLAAYYERHVPTRHTDLRIGYFHLGADIHSTNPSVGLAEDSEQVLARLSSQPTMLMVGTVEPRKGYAQAIAAFDLLWNAGVKVNLVIVGKPGWHQEKLIASLEGNPQLGKQLFWLQGVSDEYLDRVYEVSTCLLAASEGEGFGLPLIEAAQKNLPILARDLPVFREVAGEHAFYFSGAQPQDMAAAVEQWLALSKGGTVPMSSAMPWLTWEKSTQQLKAVVIGEDVDRWYRSVNGSLPPFRRGDH